MNAVIMMENMFRKVFSFLMAVVVSTAFLCSSVPVKAQEEAKEFYIRTADDLLMVAKNCTLDTWSEGVTVTLENNISMKGKKFTGIPVFAGMFEGNGYTISDVSLQNQNVDAGFFGYITENGTVRNLTVKGKVRPDRVSNAVGGIVSENRGMVTNCVFEGTVDNGIYDRTIEATQATGGIAGINTATGQIVNCKVYGTIEGLKGVGGIAGENAGTILNCTNYADITPNSKDRAMKLSEIRLSSLSGIMELFNRNKVFASECIGGIAGESNGFLISCTNDGTVGMRENGFNVGGIVGRTSGFISNCENKGEVLGSSNVGGIVGQMEPSVAVTYSGDLLEEVHDQVDGIFTSVDTTLVDANTSSDEIFTNISKMLKNIQLTANSAAEVESILTNYIISVEGTVNDEIAAANQLLKCVQSLTGSLKTTIDDAQKVSDSISDGIGHVKNITSDFSEAMGDFSDGYASDQNLIKTDVEGEIFWEYPLSEYGTAAISIPQYVIVYLLADGVVKQAQTVYPGYKTNAEGKQELAWMYSFKNLRKYSDPEQTQEIRYTVAENEMDLQSDVYHASMIGGAGAGWRVSYGTDTIFNSKGVNSAYSSFTGDSGALNQTIYWSETTESGHSDRYRPVLSDDGGDNYFYLYAHLADGSEKLLGKLSFNLSNTYAEEYSWNISVDMLPTEFWYFDTGTGQDVQVAIESYYLTCGDIADYTQQIVRDESGKIIKVIQELNDNAGRNVINAILETAAAVSGEVNGTVSDFQEAVSYTSVVMGDLSSAMAAINSIGMPALSSIPYLPEDISIKFYEMKTHLNDAISSVDGISRSVQKTKSAVLNDVRGLSTDINGAADSVFDMIYNFNLSLNSLIVDNSLAVTEEGVNIRESNSESGVVMGSRNYGKVTANEKAGGIVGTMAITRIPSLIGTEAGSGLAIPSFAYRAVVDNCVSEADIISTNNYAGMICGNQELGAIVSCKGYGNAQSIEGSYVGGISGYCHGTIADCQSQGNLSGIYYIGGIAGSGAEKTLILDESSINTSVSKVTIRNAEQYYGAIAGDNIGTFASNYYYSNELEGINGHNIHEQYENAEGKSLPITFEERQLNDLSWHKAHKKLDIHGFLRKAVGVVLLLAVVIAILWKLLKWLRKMIIFIRHKKKRWHRLNKAEESTLEEGGTQEE